MVLENCVVVTLLLIRWFPDRGYDDQKGCSTECPAVASTNYLPFITKEGKYLTEVMTRLFFATQTLVILGRRRAATVKLESIQ